MSSGHKLYTARDFTREEIERRNQLAVMVIEGGLAVCKQCGAGEAELEMDTTCAQHDNRMRIMRQLGARGLTIGNKAWCSVGVSKRLVVRLINLRLQARNRTIVVQPVSGTLGEMWVRPDQLSRIGDQT